MNSLSFQIVVFSILTYSYGCGKSVKQRGADQRSGPQNSDFVRAENPTPVEQATTKEEERSKEEEQPKEGEKLTEEEQIKQCSERGGHWLGEVCVTNEQLPHCSERYVVPGKANIYLAGMPDGTSLAYDRVDRMPVVKSEDLAPGQSPVQIIPKDARCLSAGSKLYFDASGSISHASNVAATNADGRQNADIPSHQLGAVLGKSDIKAPLNSFVGVFLRDGNPSGNISPEMLDFSSHAQRNKHELAPQIGQVFFIGDGLTDDGTLQHVVIPPGTKRLFIGIMDAWEWNNNLGELEIAIRSEAP